MVGERGEKEEQFSRMFNHITKNEVTCPKVRELVSKRAGI